LTRINRCQPIKKRVKSYLGQTDLLTSKGGVQLGLALEALKQTGTGATLVGAIKQAVAASGLNGLRQNE
jgi:hypothetical protein